MERIAPPKPSERDALVSTSSVIPAGVSAGGTAPLGSVTASCAAMIAPVAIASVAAGAAETKSRSGFQPCWGERLLGAAAVGAEHAEAHVDSVDLR